MLQNLAVAHCTHSQLQGAIAMSRRFNEDVLDLMPPILEQVADYRQPHTLQQGQYALKPECWEEVELYFPRWGKPELQRAEERYAVRDSLIDVKSSLGDAKSSLGDAKSSLGDAKSSLGDT